MGRRTRLGGLRNPHICVRKEHLFPQEKLKSHGTQDLRQILFYWRIDDFWEATQYKRERHDAVISKKMVGLHAPNVSFSGFPQTYTTVPAPPSDAPDSDCVRPSLVDAKLIYEGNELARTLKERPIRHSVDFIWVRCFLQMSLPWTPPEGRRLTQLIVTPCETWGRHSEFSGDKAVILIFIIIIT